MYSNPHPHRGSQPGNLTNYITNSMLKNSCNYRTKFKWINASSNFAISVHIDQDWDSNPEELIFVNFHEVTLFFNNEFAERVGFEPTGRQRRPPDFKSGTIDQLCHLSK